MVERSNENIDRENKMITVTMILSVILICISIIVAIMRRRSIIFDVLPYEHFCIFYTFLSLLAIFNFFISFSEKEGGQYSVNAELAMVLSGVTIVIVMIFAVIGIFMF